MSTSALLFSSDPTNHGSNVGAVALFALGIFALIGLLAFLISRRGRRPQRPTSARARAVPRPRGERQAAAAEADTRADEQNAATDAKAQ